MIPNRKQEIIEEVGAWIVFISLITMIIYAVI